MLPGVSSPVKSPGGQGGKNKSVGSVDVVSASSYIYSVRDEDQCLAVVCGETVRSVSSSCLWRDCQVSV